MARPPARGRMDRPPPPLPHIGRYRLYRNAGKRLECKLCGAHVKPENQWAHREREVAKRGERDAALILRLRGERDRAGRRAERNWRQGQRYFRRGEAQGVDVSDLE